MTLLAALLGLAMAAPGAASIPAANIDTPCRAVAQTARELPKARWSEGERALRPVLRIEESWSDAGGKSASTPVAPVVATLPFVRKMAGSSATVFVEHVPGPDLYEAYTLQGTLLCEDEVLVRAQPGGTLAPVADPSTYKGGLCWTQSADLGEVDGQPAFITHGRVNQETFDRDIEITPWAGSSWGPTCRVHLVFRTAYRLIRSDCGDLTVCRAGATIAELLARAWVEQEPKAQVTSAFHFGPPVPMVLQAKAAALQKSLLNKIPEFPTFGTEPDTAHSWSYSGFKVLGLMLDGRPYLAAVGHEGVGWREDDTILLTIYSPDAPVLKPLASFVVKQSPAALTAVQLTSPSVQSGQ